MKKWVLFVTVFFILIGVVFLILGNDSKTPPPILVKNFVNLNLIEKISKFRSCQGHIVVPTNGDEPPSNMKHYFLIKQEAMGKNRVPLYAPYEAKVSSIFSFPDQGLEGEIWLSNGSNWQFSIEHILVKDGLKKGDKVKAGELLGYAGGDDFDIVYGKGAIIQRKIHGWNSPFSALDSVFNHMSRSVFNQYIEKKIKDRQEMVYSKSFRSQNPCPFRNERGGFEGGDFTQDWVVVNSSDRLTPRAE